VTSERSLVPRKILIYIGAVAAVGSLYAYVWDGPRLPYLVFALSNLLTVCCAGYIFSTRKLGGSRRRTLSEDDARNLQIINRRVWPPFFLMLFSIFGMLLARYIHEYISEYYRISIGILTAVFVVSIVWQLSLKRDEERLYRAAAANRLENR
jgi:FtsH-binding integral membrane protein